MKSQQTFTFKEIKEKLEYYCTYQDRCHQDVEQKLFDYQLIPEAKDEILIHLIQHNFLNEERFVESFVRGKFNQKNWGKRKIAFELRRKNIPQKLIKKGLEKIDLSDYVKTLEKLYQKKRKEFGKKLSKKERNKIIQFLMQKGYEYELIKNLE